MLGWSSSSRPARSAASNPTCQEDGGADLEDVDLERLDSNRARNQAALSAAVCATSQVGHIETYVFTRKLLLLLDDLQQVTPFYSG